MTSWNSQSGDGMYSIQFETDDRELYKIVEKACQEAIDRSRAKREGIYYAENLPSILFECDRRACEKCNSECYYTAKIEHAVNFERNDVGVYEEKGYE